MYKKLNSTGRLIQRTTTEAPHGEYVLHRPGCSQEGDRYCVKDASGEVVGRVATFFASNTAQLELLHQRIIGTATLWSVDRLATTGRAPGITRF